MGQQALRAIFCYTFRDMVPADAQHGGFAINLYNDNRLVYTTYNAAMHPNGECVFTVGPEVQQRYMRMINYAMPWLRHVPDRIVMSDHPLSESSFGFHGLQIFRIEDMDQQLTLPFGSQRGHYARLVYSLFEDISSVFRKYGFTFQPDEFTWEWDVDVANQPQYRQA